MYMNLLDSAQDVHRNKTVEYISGSHCYIHTLWHIIYTVLVCSWPAHVLVLLYSKGVHSGVIVNAGSSLWSSYCNEDLTFTGDKADTVGASGSEAYICDKTEKSHNTGEIPLGIGGQKGNPFLYCLQIHTNKSFISTIDRYLL